MKQDLTGISKQTALEIAVAGIIESQARGYGSVIEWLRDLLRYGCGSGMVGSLIYYKDTNDFYDKYENDILDLVEQLGYDSLVDFLYHSGKKDEMHNIQAIKNMMAWFAFEEVAGRFLEELENS